MLESNTISFQPDQKLVHGKYHVCHKIGEGQKSSVYSITLKKKGKNLIRAIKVESDNLKSSQINTEITVLKILEDQQGAEIGFPKFFQYGSQANYNYLVLELLGPNLQQLLKLSGGKLALKTVLIIGLQIIDRIQLLHKAGFLYRDIRPDNFLMGLEDKSPIVHMIDFGKCKRYKNKTGNHIPYKQNTNFDGDIEFSSLNTHNKIQYSRRDDIQALIYMMIYLNKGRLPWTIAREFKTKKERQSVIEEIKKKMSIQHLAYKMPFEFIDLLSHIRTLNFYEKPDYDYVRTLMHQCFTFEEESTPQIVFDWNKMDQLDFTLYNGSPRIVLKTKTLIDMNQNEQDSIDRVQNQKHQQNQKDDKKKVKNQVSFNSDLLDSVDDKLKEQNQHQSFQFSFLKNMK